MLPEHIEALTFLRLVFHTCTYPSTKAVQRSERSQEAGLNSWGVLEGGRARLPLTQAVPVCPACQAEQQLPGPGICSGAAGHPSGGNLQLPRSTP